MPLSQTYVRVDYNLGRIKTDRPETSVRSLDHDIHIDEWNTAMKAIEELCSIVAGGGAAVQWQEEGGVIASRSIANFIGAAVTVADDAGNNRVNVTIAAAALTAAAPVNVTKAAALVGVSGEAARADHKHDITTAAPSSTGQLNTEGVSSSLARADHVHRTLLGVSKNSGAVVGSRPVVNVIEGTGITLTVADDPGDDEIDITIAATGATLSDLAPTTILPDAVADPGVAAEASRADHVHAIAAAAAGAILIGDAAAEGASTSFARADHTHSVAAPAAPAQLGAGVSATGAATGPARADHEHRPRVTIGAVNVLDIDTDGQVTILGGTGAAGLPGEPVAITAGAGGTGNTAGADLTLDAGAKSGSGLAGRIYAGASTARQIIAGGPQTTLVQVQSAALSLIPPGGTEGTRDVATFLAVAPAAAVAGFSLLGVEGDPNGQLAAATKGSLALDITNVELYQKSADSPSTVWKSSRRSPRTAKIIVGIETAGDTAADCDYLDTGNGAQWAAAIAAADDASIIADVYTRPGLIDLGAASGPSTPIVVPNNVRLRGALDNYDVTRIRAKTGANNQGILHLIGATDSNEQLVERFYFEVPSSASGTGQEAAILISPEETGVRIRHCRFEITAHATGVARMAIWIDDTGGDVVRTVLEELDIVCNSIGVSDPTLGLYVGRSTVNIRQGYLFRGIRVTGADIGIRTQAACTLIDCDYRSPPTNSRGLFIDSAAAGYSPQHVRVRGGYLEVGDHQDSRGILVGDDEAIEGLSIIGTHVAGLGGANDGTGIELLEATQASIVGCVIENVATGIHGAANVTYAAVVGCAIDATTPIDDDTADGMHVEHCTGPNLVEHLPRSIHLSSPAAPTGLYTLDNSLADSSGNGRTTLALAGGATNRYCQGARPNKRAWRTLVTAYGDGLQLSSGNSTWAQLTGAMSAICRVNPITDVRATVDQVNRVLIECGASDAAGGANNTAWRMMFGYSASVIVEWYSGAGPTQRRFETTELCQAVGRGFVLGFTRSSGGVVKVYRDGELIGTSGALTMPDGVTNARFCVGVSVSHAGYAYGGADISDVAVYTSELTGADMLKISRRLLGEHNAKESI